MVLTAVLGEETENNIDATGKMCQKCYASRCGPSEFTCQMEIKKETQNKSRYRLCFLQGFILPELSTRHMS